MNAVFAFSTVTTKRNAKEAMQACLAAGQEPEDVCRELRNIGPVNAAQIDLGAGPWLIPMHGMYAFVVVFPLMLVMSIAYQRYSGLLDVLMVLAPERYRNHILLRKLALKSKPPQAKPSSTPAQPQTGNWLDSMLTSVDEDSVMATKRVARRSTSLELMDLDKMDVTEVQLMGGQALYDSAGENVDYKRADLSQFHGQLTMTIERDPSLTDFIDSLDRQMKRWKRIATSITFVLMIAGLLLALLFVGSFDPEGQEDWIKGVGKRVRYSMRPWAD